MSTPKLPLFARDWPRLIPAAILIGAVLYGSFAARAPERNQVQTGEVRQADSRALPVGPAGSAAEREADGTLTIARFTVVLAVVGLVQGALFLWQLLLTRKEFRAAESRAKAANDLAGTQTALEVKQSDLAEKQHRLALEQYYAIHRPKIVIKNVFVTDEPPKRALSIDIVNTGGTKITIVSSWFCLSFVQWEAEFRDMSVGALGGVDGLVFGESEVKNVVRRMPTDVETFISRANFEELFPDGRRLRQSTDPDGRLYFFGAIRYVDERGEENGTTRLSVFRREWHSLSSSFKRTENPDHEYAD